MVCCCYAIIYQGEYNEPNIQIIVLFTLLDKKDCLVEIPIKLY
jgi:hypothetical protein